MARLSRLTQARGLKPVYAATQAAAARSRLTQARGLKQIYTQTTIGTQTSRLTQARGLKLRNHARKDRNYNVAPHAGAWIETVRAV